MRGMISIIGLGSLYELLNSLTIVNNNSSKQVKRKEFQQLFESSYPMLCLFAQKYVQDMDVAADMVQDAFLKLWEGEEFVNESAAKSFLYTEIRNNCLNYLKAQ